MRGLFVSIIVLLSLVSAEAKANKLIAVLPLDVSNTKGKLDKAAQVSLEEMLRDAATDALASSGWTVLTGETTIQVLRDNGVKPEECDTNECHLANARELKAEKFISGTVQHVEGLFVVSVRLIDTASGRIAALGRVEGKTVTVLRKELEPKVRSLFARSGLVGTIAASGQSSSSSRPMEAADPDGQNDTEDQRESFRSLMPPPTDDTQATLMVSCDPPATATVDGKFVGPAGPNQPVSYEVSAGRHTVVCWDRGERRSNGTEFVEVKVGEKRTVAPRGGPW